MNQRRPIENPKTSTLIIINIALWCIYFAGQCGFTRLAPNSFAIVMLVPVVAIVLAITTVPQWILHLVLREKRLHPFVRTTLFFTPSMLLVAIMLVTSARSDLITGTGTYPSPSGVSTLEIFRGDGTLIHYSIVDQNLDTVFQPERTFSDVHRWAFYWESDNRFWCYSSDIGTSVMIRDTEGVWMQHWLNEESEYIEEIPEELFEFLPSSAQRKWSSTE